MTVLSRYFLNMVMNLTFLVDISTGMSCVYLDEVGAIVIDIGSSTFRGGYAGEDMPKVGLHFAQRLYQ